MTKLLAYSNVLLYKDIYCCCLRASRTALLLANSEAEHRNASWLRLLELLLLLLLLLAGLQ